MRPRAAEQLPEWTEDSFAGILPNVTAGRVANRFDLGALTSGGRGLRVVLAPCTWRRGNSPAARATW